MGRNRKKGGGGGGAVATEAPVVTSTAAAPTPRGAWELIDDDSNNPVFVKKLPDGTELTVVNFTEMVDGRPRERIMVEIEGEREGSWQALNMPNLRNADGTVNVEGMLDRVDKWARRYFPEDAAEEGGPAIESGFVDFLNEIGRETGAPGFFDRLLRGEPMQSPQAIAESRKLAEDSAKAGNMMVNLVQRMAPDQMTGQQAAAARQAITQAIQAAGGALSREDVANMQRIAGMLTPNFLDRQRNRVLGGINALGNMHNDVAAALRRGTNAGIQEALDRTSGVENGLRTTVDTVLQGATQQEALLRRLNALSKRAAKQGFPEPARQAIIQAIRSLPLQQLERSSGAALETVARLGRRGLLPSVLGVANARRLGGRQGIRENVQETAEGIGQAISMTRGRKGGTPIADEMAGRLRALERASAVARSGR